MDSCCSKKLKLLIENVLCGVFRIATWNQMSFQFPCVISYLQCHSLFVQFFADTKKSVYNMDIQWRHSDFRNRTDAMQIRHPLQRYITFFDFDKFIYCTLYCTCFIVYLAFAYYFPLSNSPPIHLTIYCTCSYRFILLFGSCIWWLGGLVP